MVWRNMKAHDAFRVLQERVTSAIAAAPAERSVSDLEELYRETNAWIFTTCGHPDAPGRTRTDPPVPGYSASQA
jgi:hypothetical protein